MNPGFQILLDAIERGLKRGAADAEPAGLPVRHARTGCLVGHVRTLEIAAWLGLRICRGGPNDLTAFVNVASQLHRSPGFQLA